MSVIRRNISRAEEMIIIFADPKCGDEARNFWNKIISASMTYKYAEQFPLGNTLKNWPNSSYQLPPGNNSNTFVREMAREIGKNADIIGSPWLRPGANTASPIPDPGYTPIHK